MWYSEKNIDIYLNLSNRKKSSVVMYILDLTKMSSNGWLQFSSTEVKEHNRKIQLEKEKPIVSIFNLN